MEKLDNIKKGYVIPIYKVIERDLNPTDIFFSNVLDKFKNCYLLESAIFGINIARYSFIGFGEHILEAKDEKNIYEKLNNIRRILRMKVKSDKRLPRFLGGYVGYISYDFIRYFEKLPENSLDVLKHKDFELMFSKSIIAFDHWKEKIFLISNIILDEDKDVKEELVKAKEEIEFLEEIVTDSNRISPENEYRDIEFSSNFTKEEFCEMVEIAKEYIKSGEIFQVVLSQRFKTLLEHDLKNVYLSLKKINPSPYMFFLKFNNLKIIGSSPEILVRVNGDKAITRPIAGTRPRGKNSVEDEMFARELINDEKERAEHVMLVDLGRNDLGRVCEFGTVKVTEFMVIEKYSHVQHMVSNVEGKLRKDKDALDALISCFPAGTVTGAPKIRAMEIIDELEKERRGIYAGAVGYFSFNNQSDFAITIRTMFTDDKYIYTQTGAGIVYDSIPEREYQETINKAKAIFKALRISK